MTMEITCWVCTSIMIGAYSAEMIVSSSVLNVRPRTPPQPLRTFDTKMPRSRPSTFGVNSTIIVKMNSFVMRGASNTGQLGNSWNSLLKYSGRINEACSVSAKPTSSSINQSGEDK